MATDYISREAAIDAIWKPEVRPNDLIFDALRRACEEEVKHIPTADVVEVVRCSVCKKVVLEDRGNGKIAYWCPVNRNYRCWGEFCNRGERMADNGT